MLKDEIIKVIDNMPDNSTIEDIQYSLYVRSKIEKGLNDIDNGNLVSQDEVEGRMLKWLRK